MFVEYVKEEAEKARPEEVDEIVREATSRCLIEAFNARAQGRKPEMREARGLRAAKLPPAKPNDQSMVTLATKIKEGTRRRDIVVKLQRMTLDDRGIVEVWCQAEVSGNPIPLDLPLYVVNPPLLVDEEDEDGNIQYLEDPLQALLNSIVRMVAPE